MSTVSPDSIYKRAAENERLSLKARIAALAKVENPSMALLNRLMRSGRPKLELAAADRLRDLLKQDKPETADAIAALLR